jgi:hypothetical protein
MLRAFLLVHSATIVRPNQDIVNQEVALGTTPVGGTQPCRFDHELDDALGGPMGAGSQATYGIEFLPGTNVRIGDRVTWLEDGRVFEITALVKPALMNSPEGEAVMCVGREMEGVVFDPSLFGFDLAVYPGRGEPVRRLRPGWQAGQLGAVS